MNLILCALLMTAPIFAEDLYVKQALQKTQELLKDRTKRQAAVNSNKAAKDIDSKAGALAGSEKNKDKMYDIASGVLEKMVAETNGDAKKMQAILDKAQKDPEAFYNSMFDAEQKVQLEQLSKDIEKSQGKAPAKP